jgi:D-alanyl-lipoteichoic acid acyltransferase DltB (MBOAT superfamily)
MLFNSIEFFAFFPLVTTLYFVVPHRWRWALLLAASACFYMAFVPIYILILGFTIAVDYGAGILIERASGARRRAWLVMSLAANIGVLAVFKYWNFLAENSNGVLAALHVARPMPLLEILLPIGLSFHTFQAMSYTIEVFRGRQAAERHFGIYALYVMFYPQLVAGPIERPQNLLHQFRERHVFEADRVLEGLSRMLAGLFKKVVVADQLAVVVSQVYGRPQHYGAGALLLATWAFAVQIYCDFAGYSDIAIGAARVMGFSLMENFDRPYFATSIVDFWRRWHVSLSTWFKDYLYLPLGGNRVATPTRARNLLIVFVVSGLWHGAAWTFVVWGAVHGLYVVTSVITAQWRVRVLTALGVDRSGPLLTVVRIVVTFNLVSLAWIFFRAGSLSDAIYILERLAAGAAYAAGHSVMLLSQAPAAIAAMMRLRTAVWASAAAVFLLLEIRDRRLPFVSAAAIPAPWLRASLAYATLLLLLVAGRFGHHSCIYFQF